MPHLRHPQPELSYECRIRRPFHLQSLSLRRKIEVSLIEESLRFFDYYLVILMVSLDTPDVLASDEHLLTRIRE